MICSLRRSYSHRCDVHLETFSYPANLLRPPLLTPRIPVPTPAVLPTLLKHEDAATSAAGAWDLVYSSSDATAE